jgi:hypothetical protein
MITKLQFGLVLEELGDLEVLHVELGLLSGRQISQHFAHDGAELEAWASSHSALSYITSATDHGRCTHCSAQCWGTSDARPK